MPAAGPGLFEAEQPFGPRDEGMPAGCNPYDPANGSLMIEGLPITELPESLTVGGVIRAAGSHLTWEGISEKLRSKVHGLGPFPPSSSC